MHSTFSWWIVIITQTQLQSPKKWIYNLEIDKKWQHRYLKQHLAVSLKKKMTQAHVLCVAMLLFVFALEFSVRALCGCATLGFQYRKGGEVFAAFILSPCIQLDNPSTSDTFWSCVTFACENILSSIVFPCHHNAVIPDSDAPLLRSLYT